MAKKAFIKSFEDFRGLDLRSSALTRKDNYASECINTELRREGEGWAIQSRKGYSVVSQPYPPIFNEQRCEYPYQGVFNYTYQDTFGATQEETIGIGNKLFRLHTGTVAITYTGAGTATFSCTPSVSGFIVDLQVNAASQAGFPLGVSYGKSLADPSLNALRTAINAIANFACVLTPWAQVNGNQTGAGVGQITTPITVFAGHTVTVSTASPTRIELNDQTGGSTRVCRDVVETTATTIRLQAERGWGDIDVLNNDIIGIGLYPAALLGYIPTTTITATASVFNITYWQSVLCPNFIGGTSFYDSPFEISAPSEKGYGFGVAAQNYHGVNKSNCFYIGAKKAVNRHTYSLRTKSGLWRYDGATVHGADIPPGIIVGATPSAGAGLSIGNYQYIARYKHIDARGNIWYGPDNRFSYYESPTISPGYYQTAAVTTAGGTAQVTITLLALSNGFTGFPAENAYRNYIGATKNGLQAMVGGVPLVCNVTNSNFRVGNVVTFLNATDGRIQRETITAVNNGTISFTPTRAGNIAAASYMTNNITVELWRTKVGGNIFYLNQELPLDVTAAGTNTVYVDAYADTTLLQQYEDPLYPPDVPPIFEQITTHQGLIVGVGDPENPQTVFWSLDAEDNGFPIATNSLDINTLANDNLTCCASDTESMLAVFSNRTYTNITGDLSSLSISVDTTLDGDVGCPSPHTVKKVRDQLIFLSLKGFRTIQGGRIMPIDDRLASRFVNQFYIRASQNDPGQPTKFTFLRANAIHDIENQRYICFIPKETKNSASVAYCANEASKCYVYDYQNDFWSEWITSSQSTSGPCAPLITGGGTLNQLSLYFVQQFSSSPAYNNKDCQLYKLNNSNALQDYHDACTAISRSLSPQWEFYNEPSVDKKFLHGKVWSLGNTLGNFAIRVRAYRNFNTSTVDTDATLNFTTSLTELTWKFKENKCRSMQLNFSDATILTNPIISGYEYVVAIAYGMDDLKEIG